VEATGWGEGFVGGGVGVIPTLLIIFTKNHIDMSTLQLKSELHILIDHLQDNDILNAVKTLLGRSVNIDTDFWDELSESDKAEIKEGIEDIEAGRTYTYQEIFTKYGL
jgi:predicted transcriptional regulator